MTVLRELAAAGGTDGWVAAEDYFISSRDGFPWHKIPNVVIGRVAYDNWMVGFLNTHSPCISNSQIK